MDLLDISLTDLHGFSLAYGEAQREVDGICTIQISIPHGPLGLVLDGVSVSSSLVKSRPPCLCVCVCVCIMRALGLLGSHGCSAAVSVRALMEHCVLQGL